MGLDVFESKIALIGGSGFIGQRMVRYLTTAGHVVKIIDIAVPPASCPDVAYENCDVRDLPALTEAIRGHDLVINLAAAHRDDVRPVSLYHDVNVQGAQNVCDAAEACGIDRIFFTSSVAIYGLQEGVPDEDTPAKPFNLYGETKWQAEKVYESWLCKAPQQRQLLMVRPTVVFGPGNRGNVYGLIKQLASGFFIMIGDGKNRKSMAYVENIASFLAYLAQNRAPGETIYNYVDKPDFSMNELLRVVRTALGNRSDSKVRLPYFAGMAIASLFDAAAAVTGRNFPISRVRVQKFCANTVFDAQRLSRTGFVPVASLADALSLTIAHEFPGRKQDS
jgi:nucleoside-diphosphate-sugar epimerase